MIKIVGDSDRNKYYYIWNVFDKLMTSDNRNMVPV